MVHVMNGEEKYLERRLYKLTLWLLKVIPMILAACAALNTFLGFYGIQSAFLSFFGGISLLPLAFLYLSSYVFRFCIYHRLFLHYILVTDLLNLFDFYIGIPLCNRALFGMYVFLTCLLLFLVLYFYRKEKCCKR